MDDLSPQARDAVHEIAEWLEHTALTNVRNKSIKDGVLVAAHLLRTHAAQIGPGDTREIYLLALPQVLPWATEVYANAERTSPRGEIVSWNAMITDNARSKRAELDHAAVRDAMLKLVTEPRYHAPGSSLDIADLEPIQDLLNANTPEARNAAMDGVTRNAAEAVVQIAIYGEFYGHLQPQPLKA